MEHPQDQRPQNCGKDQGWDADGNRPNPPLPTGQLPFAIPDSDDNGRAKWEHGECQVDCDNDTPVGSPWAPSVTLKRELRFDGQQEFNGFSLVIFVNSLLKKFVGLPVVSIVRAWLRDDAQETKHESKNQPKQEKEG
jgi:hypothetical protein